jgi:superfamily II DNA helicase RecQ
VRSKEMAEMIHKKLEGISGVYHAGIELRCRMQMVKDWQLEEGCKH